MLSVAAAVTCLLPPGATAPPARAATVSQAGEQVGQPTHPSLDSEAASVAVTGLTPAVAIPGQPVKLTVRVVAGMDRTKALVLQVRRSDRDIVARADVSRWAAETEPALGTVVASATVPDLAAHEAGDVQVTIPASALRTTRPYDALPVAVVLLKAGAPTQTVRTFVMVHGIKEYEPLSVSVAIPVTLPPDPHLVATDEEPRLAAWKAAIGPASPVARLIEAMASLPVTWIVDPAAIDPAPVIPSAAETDGDPDAGADPAPDPAVTATGAPAVGDQSGADPAVAGYATALAASLRSSAGTIWRLPYADPDLAALLTLDSGPAELTRLATRPSSLDGPLIAWPADGSIRSGRDPRVASAFGAALGAVLVETDTLEQTSGYSPTGATKTPAGSAAVLIDSRLSELLGSDALADPVVTRQRALADSMALLDESPGLVRSVALVPERGAVADPQAQAAVLRALLAAPWIRAAPAQVLLDAAAAAAPNVQVVGRDGAVVAIPKLARSPLTETRVGTLVQERRDITTVAGVVGTDAVQAAALSARWTDRIDQLLATRWRGSRAWNALYASATENAQTATQSVRVLSASLNFLADQGTLRVTVVNDLDLPIRDLSLVLQPQNPRLVVVGPPPTVTIAAKSRGTYTTEVQAVAAGLVPVRAVLQTADGTQIGAAATISVRANPPAAWWWWGLAGINGVILIIGVIRGLRRRRPTPVLAPIDPDE
jgi:hypothetical protein